MNNPLIVALAEGLAIAGCVTLRFNFPYKEKGKKSPDSQQKLIHTWQCAYAYMQHNQKFPVKPIIAVGKSMGGRVVSQMVAEGLMDVASYAEGIGPWLSQIYLGKTATGTARLSELVSQAQARGLKVHPYTFRQDELPQGIDSFRELLDIFILQAGVDGLFTDFTDLVVDYLSEEFP